MKDVTISNEMGGIISENLKEMYHKICNEDEQIIFAEWNDITIIMIKGKDWMKGE